MYMMKKVSSLVHLPVGICRKEISRFFPLPFDKIKNAYDSYDHHRYNKYKQISSKDSLGEWEFEGSRLMISVQELSDGCPTSPSYKRNLNTINNGNSTSVGKGQLAVYVGPELKRYVIPTSYLSMPDLRGLMDRVAEEYGHDLHKDGGLRIPICGEDDFEDILQKCSASLVGLHPGPPDPRRESSSISTSNF